MGFILSRPRKIMQTYSPILQYDKILADMNLIIGNMRKWKIKSGQNFNSISKNYLELNNPIVFLPLSFA